MTPRITLVWLRVDDCNPAGAGALSLLDDGERARAERFTVDQPRRVFVAARAALRITLAADLGIDPRSLKFEVGRHGKPRLEPTLDLEFNLAHSGSTVVICCTRGTAVGVDVEELHREVPAVRLARRFFSTVEAEAVAAASDDARQRLFLHYWTAKEAVLKATGSGLTVPVRTVEISPDPDAPPRVSAMAGDRGAARQWRLLRCQRPDEWIATIAHRGPRRDLRVTRFPGI